jgi:hypothetical protein
MDCSSLLCALLADCVFVLNADAYGTLHASTLVAQHTGFDQLLSRSA